MKPCCFSLWQWSGGVYPLVAIICQLLLLGAEGTEQDGWHLLSSNGEMT
ncbi:hypothetical protein EVA_03198 [gut metagenome]|uniref:Uncharacterized protein n=1 Tax=gut metagenome TaxID=749906 RepID=J9GME5_9ZZZZ